MQIIYSNLKKRDEFHRYVVRNSTQETLTSLQLDEGRSIGYTFKCLGAGFWGLCSKQNFQEALNMLIKEAGDADTNGAVFGAMLGCKLGYSQLPKEWLVALPNRKWLDNKVVEFLKLIELI